MYYDKENQVIINHSVNEFYTRFLLKIDVLLQEVGFPLDIASKFFHNLSPGVRDFLISEGVKVPKRIPTETNHQGNQRLILVGNSAVESEKNIRKIKSAVQPAGGSLHHMKFMRMSRGSPSIKTAGLKIIFQDE